MEHQDNIGHWDLAAKEKVRTETFWWQSLSEIKNRVTPCKGYQKLNIVPEYSTNLTLLASALFEIFFIDKSGSLQLTKNGTWYLLVAV